MHAIRKNKRKKKLKFKIKDLVREWKSEINDLRGSLIAVYNNDWPIYIYIGAIGYVWIKDNIYVLNFIAKSFFKKN